jgi:hypothetical protein
VKVDLATPSADRAPHPAAAANPQPATGNSPLTGTIRGLWGFDPFTGPTMPLEETPGRDWKLAGDAPLIVGPGGPKDQHVLLTSTGTACIQSISLEPDPGKSDNQSFKLSAKPNTVDVTLDVSALATHTPEALHLTIHQFGDPKPDTVTLLSYAEPAKLTALEFHAGDRTAVLTGSSLNEVSQLELGDSTFIPQSEPTPAATENSNQPASSTNTLTLALDPKVPTPRLAAGAQLTAHVTLKDGRTLPIVAFVKPERPTLTLIGKVAVQPENTPRPALQIKLASPDDLPIADALMFSLRTQRAFPRTGKIEVASPDDSLHTALTVATDTLILEDPKTLLAKLEPLKTFGPSAFGPLRLRSIAADGTPGDWLPLVTLVRLPSLTGLTCPVSAPTPPQPHPSPTKPPVAPTAAPVVDPVADTTTPTTDNGERTTVNTPAPTPQPATGNQQLPCTLTGTGLYLIDSIATDPAFTNPTRVPDGFVGTALTVPPPSGELYYLRLRDDPTPTDTITLPSGPLAISSN